jgi:hypothetical protein
MSVCLLLEDWFHSTLAVAFYLFVDTLWLISELVGELVAAISFLLSSENDSNSCVAHGRGCHDDGRQPLCVGDGKADMPEGPEAGDERYRLALRPGRASRDHLLGPTGPR